MRAFTALVVVCAALSSTVALAQDAYRTSDSHPALSHRHGLELGVGLLAGVSAGTSAESGGASVDSDVSGLMGSLTYLYRLDDRILLTVGAGALSVDATVSASSGNASVESSTVSMVLFGVRYQFPGLDERGNLRPYASLGVGPYVGTASAVRAGPSTYVGARTETVPGARVGLGLAAGLNTWLMAGIGAGYHLVADFDERVGAETNYSNPDLLLTFGVRFGATAWP
jgi:hypothetical protein